MSKKKKKEEEVAALEETDEEETDVGEVAVDPVPVAKLFEKPLHELFGENPPLHILNKFS